MTALNLHCCVAFSPVVGSGGCSKRCVDFSLWWLLLFRSTGCRSQASVVVARGLSSSSFWALEHRLNSCGTRASLLSSIWNLPAPGIRLISPPGKPSLICLACCHQATLSSYLSSSALNTFLIRYIYVCVYTYIYVHVCVDIYIISVFVYFF